MAAKDAVTKGQRKRPLRGKDVALRGAAAKEAKALEATMTTHRAGYDAYRAARKDGRKAEMEKHRADYRAFKAAYRQLLALRRAAHERQQAKGGEA